MKHDFLNVPYYIIFLSGHMVNNVTYSRAIYCVTVCIVYVHVGARACTVYKQVTRRNQTFERICSKWRWFYESSVSALSCFFEQCSLLCRSPWLICCQAKRCRPSRATGLEHPPAHLFVCALKNSQIKAAPVRDSISFNVAVAQLVSLRLANGGLGKGSVNIGALQSVCEADGRGWES